MGKATRNAIRNLRTALSLSCSSIVVDVAIWLRGVVHVMCWLGIWLSASSGTEIYNMQQLHSYKELNKENLRAT